MRATSGAGAVQRAPEQAEGGNITPELYRDRVENGARGGEMTRIMPTLASFTVLSIVGRQRGQGAIG